MEKTYAVFFLQFLAGVFYFIPCVVVGFWVIGKTHETIKNAFEKRGRKINEGNLLFVELMVCAMIGQSLFMIAKCI